MNAPAFLPVEPVSSPDALTKEHIAYYRRNGFVRVRGIVSKAEAETFAQEALRIREEWLAGRKGEKRSAVFDQIVNTWPKSEIMKQLVFHPTVTAVVKKLAGVPMRIWHDHILIKEPGKSVPTEFHQDQPYWPHAEGSNPISMWIALRDVPVERGCMTFIPGCHHRDELEMQNLRDNRSLISKAAEMEYLERVTIPLQAGDCTFHHGRCPHMANANTSDESRVALAVIYMDKNTLFTGRGHVVTKDLGLPEGQPFDHALFPEI